MMGTDVIVVVSAVVTVVEAMEVVVVAAMEMNKVEIAVVVADDDLLTCC